jgi:hypothetical protein
MNVAQYLAARKAEGFNLHTLANASGVAYSTLHPHVKHGKALGLIVARKLEAWSNDQATAARMTAAEILGLAEPSPPDPDPADPDPAPPPTGSPRRKRSPAPRKGRAGGGGSTTRAEQAA